MENLKIRVTTEQESKEAQELFFELRYDKSKHCKWLIDSCIKFLATDGDFLYCWDDEKFGDTRFESLNHKEITLQELRDMVKQKAKEYLFKYNDQYTLVELSKEDAESNPEQYIKVPEGAEKLTLDESKTLTFWKSEYESMNVREGNFWVSSKSDGILTFSEYSEYPYTVLWQREKESLNDKIASAEVARQELKKIDATLAERQSQYGSFEDVAFVTENIMATLAKVRSNGLQDLPHTHRMALYMIASKMARIVNGDFNHLDSWHDIGGYSKLIEDLITVDQ